MKYLNILIAIILLAGCNQNEEVKIIKKENEISTFLRILNKDNSPYSVKILSNVKQIINGSSFYKSTNGEIIRLAKNEKSPIIPNVFYDFMEFKHIENANSIIVDLTYLKPSKDQRIRISITISKPNESRDKLTKIISTGSIYIPSNFEFQNGITSLLEEEIEQRIGDYILKALYKSTKK